MLCEKPLIIRLIGSSLAIADARNIFLCLNPPSREFT